MLTHGFTIAQMAELVRAGLASALAERVVGSSRTHRALWHSRESQSPLSVCVAGVFPESKDSFSSDMASA
jgi:hypothetical protein